MRATRVGTILLRQGRITQDQLNEAIAQQDGSDHPLGAVLVQMGHVSEEDVGRALAVQLSVPFVEFGETFRLEPEDAKLIPEAVARRFCLVPIRENGSPKLTVVMDDPLDIEAADTVRSLTNLEVHRAVGTRTQIMAVIDKFYKEDAYIESNLKDLIDLEAGGAEAEPDGPGVDAEQLKVLANDAPVVRFVNLLLMQAVRDRASDIHFEPGEHDVTIRLRVDGILREVPPPPKSLYPGIVTRIKILSEMDIAERRLPLDGRFKFKANGRVIDVRVSSLPEVHGEKVVLRILDREALLLDMRDIGFDDDMLSGFTRILSSPHGMVLLTGPTGSGKTSTLYSALSFLKSAERNIQTVEDPVEYLLPGINQMQSKAAIGLDFANALRAILRQDPDIIMVGEIRDVETARMAIRAALTGHLVLSTLHTNDSPSAFWRLRDIGIESFLTAATIKLVLSQRLVRIICANCKQAAQPEPEALRMAAAALPESASWSFFRGAGCFQCGQTGFHGRTAILEFLEVTRPIRDMVIDESGEDVFRRRAIELGMAPLLINGLRKVARGVTTLEEVLRAAPLGGA